LNAIPACLALQNLIELLRLLAGLAIDCQEWQAKIANPGNHPVQSRLVDDRTNQLGRAICPALDVGPSSQSDQRSARCPCTRMR
jgi:hypothetical protein